MSKLFPSGCRSMNSGSLYPFDAVRKLDRSYSPPYETVLTGVVRSSPWSRVMVVTRTGVGGVVVRRWTSWSLKKREGTKRERGQVERGDAKTRRQVEMGMLKRGKEDLRMEPSIEVAL